MKGIFKALSYAFHGSCTDIKTCFSRIFFPKCNKPIVKWYKPHGAIQPTKTHSIEKIIKYRRPYFNAKNILKFAFEQ